MSQDQSTNQAEAPKTRAHQWTYDGDKVLVVRQCARDSSSSHGFVWPKSGPVECPDWQPHNRCGNGLHGWPWGLAMGDGAEPRFDDLWLVVAVDPKNVIDVEDAHGKVKFKNGEVIFAGEWWKARELTEKGRNAWVSYYADGQSSATGYSSASSATGDASVAACTGLWARARAGKFGAIALSWWNEKDQRAEMRCARVVDGENGTLKPNVWYQLNENAEFVEIEEPKE